MNEHSNDMDCLIQWIERKTRYVCITVFFFQIYRLSRYRQYHVMWPHPWRQYICVSIGILIKGTSISHWVRIHHFFALTTWWRWHILLNTWNRRHHQSYRYIGPIPNISKWSLQTTPTPRHYFKDSDSSVFALMRAFFLPFDVISKAQTYTPLGVYHT